jgi:hypothetical protein
LALALALMRNLVPLGALTVRNALEVMFSFRDLRAISLLDRLERTHDTHEEEELLEALQDAPSSLAAKGLLERVKSPRFAVRLDSLAAIETLPNLSEDTEKALIGDIVNNPYTTAYISARILGNHHVTSAIPILRELVSSDDYMLSGEAMIALARLGDEAFRPRIEEIIAAVKNPRLKIMGVEAFGIYRNVHSLSVLLDILDARDPPPYLRDEVTLAMADILDTHNLFYKLLVRFREDEGQVMTLAMDEAESAVESYRSTLGSRALPVLHAALPPSDEAAAGGRKHGGRGAELILGNRLAGELQPAVSALMRLPYPQTAAEAAPYPAAASVAGTGTAGAVPLARWILELPAGPGGAVDPVVQTVLAEAILDDKLCCHKRLRLLVAQWSARQLRLLAKRLKNQRTGGPV